MACQAFGEYSRPRGDTRFRDLSQAKQPLPSAELDNEFNSLKSHFNSLQTITQNISEWAHSQNSPAYVSANSFTLTTNLTGTMTAGRAIRVSQNSGYVYSRAASSTYNSLTNKTTVILDDSVLAPGMSNVYYGIISPDLKSMPMGTVVKTSLFANLSTAKVYAETNNRPLLIDSAVTANNLTLKNSPTILQGGSIAVASGKTLTTPTPDAGLYQVFSGSGVVTGLSYVETAWFPSGTTGLQSALNAGAAKHVNVSKPDSTDQLSIPSGTHVSFAPGAVLTRANGATEFSNILDATGVLGSTTSLTANGTLGATTVAVVSAAGLAVGQVVKIADLTYAFDTTGQNMELNVITAINGLTITLQTPLISSYATASTASLTPFTSERKNIVIENPNLVIPAGVEGGGILFNLCYNCEVRNPTISGMKHQPGVNFYKSAYGRLTGGTITDGQSLDQPGHGYGYNITESSHNCEVSGVTTRNIRENGYGGGAKYSKIHHCNDAGAYDNSWNTHASGDSNNEISDNLSTNSRRSGIVIGYDSGNAGDIRTKVLRNTIINAAIFGIVADGGTLPGTPSIEPVIEGNTLINCGWSTPDPDPRYPILVNNSTNPLIKDNVIRGLSNNPRAGIYLQNSTDVRVVGNKVTGIAAGWGLIHNGITGLTIDGNQFFDNFPSIATIYTEGTASTEVWVHGNRSDGAIVAQGIWDVYENNVFGSVVRMTVDIDPTPPAAAGTPATFTVTDITKGIAAFDYAFWVKEGAGEYVLVQAYSSDTSYQLATTGKSGVTFAIAVQARLVGEVGTFDIEKVVYYVVP